MHSLLKKNSSWIFGNVKWEYKISDELINFNKAKEAVLYILEGMIQDRADGKLFNCKGKSVYEHDFLKDRQSSTNTPQHNLLTVSGKFRKEDEGFDRAEQPVEQPKDHRFEYLIFTPFVEFQGKSDIIYRIEEELSNTIHEYRSLKQTSDLKSEPIHGSDVLTGFLKEEEITELFLSFSKEFFGKSLFGILNFGSPEVVESFEIRLTPEVNNSSVDGKEAHKGSDYKLSIKIEWNTTSKNILYAPIKTVFNPLHQFLNDVFGFDLMRDFEQKKQ
jgi:hypothetical protein